MGCVFLKRPEYFSFRKEKFCAFAFGPPLQEMQLACTPEGSDPSAGALWWQVTGNVFEKKDKQSKKVQANFSDFWEKFVMHAPEVRLAWLKRLPCSFDAAASCAVPDAQSSRAIGPCPGL